MSFWEKGPYTLFMFMGDQVGYRVPYRLDPPFERPFWRTVEIGWTGRFVDVDLSQAYYREFVR